MDGLRGLAALWVLLYHLWHYPAGAILSRIAPAALAWLAVHGKLGVQVFFVLSGFVIAHSLERQKLDARATALFIARRQVRLDPCYWAALALATANVALSRALGHDVPYPSAGTYALHVGYLQDVAGAKNMLSPSWSLCIEIQLYLVFVFLLHARRAIAVLLVTALLVGSLVVTALGVDLHVWFIAHWYLFALGALAYWTHRRAVPRGLLVGALVAAIAVFAYAHAPEPLVGAATATALGLAARRRALESWLGDRLSQYFGRISYPLYLVHVDVGIRVIASGLGIDASPRATVLWVVLAAAACFLVAHILHLLVERPSLGIASRLRPGYALARGRPRP